MVKSVAVVGAGAAGAAAAAALHAENHFTKIRVFERRETAGGTWIYDAKPDTLPLKPGALPADIDPPLKTPSHFPTTTPPSSQNRFTNTPIYEDLTTNVPDIAMSFSDIPFAYGPFVPHHIPRQYIETYFSWHGTDEFLRLRTTVENVERLKGEGWGLVLRKRDAVRDVDEWWEEEFDALILANGHYSVPFIPPVPGLDEYIARFPNKVIHSKTYRTPRIFDNQQVLVIGTSASAYDITSQLLESGTVKTPIHVSRRSLSSPGRLPWERFPADSINWLPVITEYRPDGTIVFQDGTQLRDIDSVIYCTGYKASYPFWKGERPLYDYKADKLVNNYQHTFINDYQTLAFIGIPRVLTFRSFEYQAVAIARLWAGRNSKPLPPLAERKAWEEQRAARQGKRFHQIEWDNGETMEWFRWLFEFAGLPNLEGEGRCPPALGRETRWAIEHEHKYPKPKGRTEDWIDVDEPVKDSLNFI